MPAQPENITIPAPSVPALVFLSDTLADVRYLLPEEERTVVLDEAHYYLLPEEDRVWHI